ncbi:MAG: tRNA 2-selenouridine(34) synthase MnmH [Desulfobulbaceae bacterium]|nr:tRNA 2-selenouridine(34) synthase MnmH [Desulfobulbaceae bacterium]
MKVKDVLADPERIVVDLRTPGEYAQGHIPGSVNIPLFTDEERAKVGTLYKQAGKEIAFQHGLKFTGPRLAEMVKRVRNLAKGRHLVFYCWRGGMRSESVCWLMRLGGMNVSRIKGGYKAYRRYIRASFAEPANMVILGGYTGAGKTDVLLELARQDVQIVDLEGVANHKGSVFGHINEGLQPTSEQYENNLFEVWQLIDKKRVVVVENESASVGSVSVPEPFYRQMRKAPVVSIAIPLKRRVQRLVAEYGVDDTQQLLEAVQRIARKLGGKNKQKVENYISKHQFAEACELLLEYYDKYYERGMQARDIETYQFIELEGVDVVADTGKVKALILEHY